MQKPSLSHLSPLLYIRFPPKFPIFSSSPNPSFIHIYFSSIHCISLSFSLFNQLRVTSRSNLYDVCHLIPPNKVRDSKVLEFKQAHLLLLALKISLIALMRSSYLFLLTQVVQLEITEF